MNFTDLEIEKRIIDALHKEGYTEPTPIQQKAIPLILDGKDVLASAQTGTGKTAAFAIPTIQKLSTDKGSNKVKALVLSPTRELAQQIYESFNSYARFTKVKSTVIFGGVNQKRQVNALKKNVDVVIATPGRLMDLMNQRLIDLSHVETFILDEADRMLDMGFIHDINRINDSLPKQRQTLLFSATISKEIEKIAKTLMNNPVIVETETEQTTAETVTQYLYYIDNSNKQDLLIDLIKNKYNGSVLVFVRTKRDADRLAKELARNGIKSDSIHGDKSQGQRRKALSNFKNYRVQALVATDVAARGIDIDELQCVVNYNIPDEAETYVHRIGRTGRAGELGESVAFCHWGERGLLKDIQRLTGEKIEVIDEHDYPLKDKNAQPPNRGGGRGRRKGRGGNKKRGGRGNKRKRNNRNQGKSNKKKA